MRWPVSEPIVSCAKERRFPAPSDQPQTSEPPDSETEVQDGGGEGDQGPIAERGLDDLYRSERCISLSPSGQRAQKVPQVCVGEHSVRVPVPALRAEQCPAHIYQTVEAGNGSPEEERDQVHNIPGRFTDHGESEERIGIFVPRDNPPAPAPGIQNKLRKVAPDPNPNHQVPRLLDRLHKDDNLTSRGQGTGHHPSMPDSCPQTVRDLARLLGRMSATAMAVLPAPICYRSLQRQRNAAFAIYQSFETQVQLNQASLEELQWWIKQLPQWNGRSIPSPLPGYHSRDGCLPAWMGGGSQRDQHRGVMVGRRTIPAYQPSGTDGRGLCNKDLFERETQHLCPPEDGQYSSYLVYQPHGRNEISESVTQGMRTMAMVPSTWDHPVGRASTRSNEHCSGHRISHSVVISRVETQSRSVHQDHANTRILLDRSVCIQTEQSAPQVHELAPRPIRSRHRCTTDALVERERLRFPTLCADRQMPQKDSPGRMFRDTSSPGMGHSTMVPYATRAPRRSPTTTTGIPTPVTGPFQQDPSPTGKRATTISRMEALRRHHTAEGISTRASDLIQAGWSKGTNSVYQSGWNKWDSWCATRSLNPLSCDIHFFLDFLAELFQQGLQYRTLNTIRSSVSMTHNQVEGVPIGQHPLVTRLLKGAHNLRPPKPCYTSTWDVDVVIKYLCSIGEDEDLSRKQLSQKLALLMAMVEASRTSELRALDLRFRVFRPDGVLFRLATLTKKRAPGKPPKEVFFGAFPDNKRLCVRHCLRQYEKVTAKSRPDGEKDNPLFLSYNRPYSPVTSQRIAHWIKDILELTQRFSRHTRYVAPRHRPR